MQSLVKSLSFKLLKHSWLHLCSLAWGDVLKPGEMQTVLSCALLCRTAPPGTGLRHPGPLPDTPAACTVLGTIKITALHFQNAPQWVLSIREESQIYTVKENSSSLALLSPYFVPGSQGLLTTDLEDHFTIPIFTHKEMKVQGDKGTWPRSPIWWELGCVTPLSSFVRWLGSKHSVSISGTRVQRTAWEIWLGSFLHSSTQSRMFLECVN